MKYHYSIIISFISFLQMVSSQESPESYWPDDWQRIQGKGNWSLGNEHDIVWVLGDRDDLPYNDHIAMSGQSVDMILEWGVDENKRFSAKRLIRWPMLRTLPDDTHAALDKRIGDKVESTPTIDDKLLSDGTVKKIYINGTLIVENEHPEQGILSKRTIFPSVLSPAIIDIIELTNVNKKTVSVKVPKWKNEQKTEESDGLFGVYIISEQIEGYGLYHISPGETMQYAIVRSARSHDDPPYYGNSRTELSSRQSFLHSKQTALVLETPNEVLNRLFYFSKIRATESIFSTRGGLMHGPGGYNKFLAAIWANDQAEYVNPLFPFIGDPIPNESAMNSFRHFSRFMNEEYKPIPSSIVAEGRDIWNGAGDRGDMAMLAYGASLYALLSGDKNIANELMPLINWCLEYLNRNQKKDGSIWSDSDELEERFPSGDANLFTIALYYDALISTSYIEKDLNGNLKKANELLVEAKNIKKIINTVFSATVEGFDTYQYFKGNKKLRSWICLPLYVGILDKAETTIDALFSDKLWTKNGLLTESGRITVWDRSTLFALKGVFKAGYSNIGLEKLNSFSKQRLLGSHVPYVIEAYPEANQSHLSAESGLYCRIFTDGIFGIRPTGFSSFECVPSMPSNWDTMSLKNIAAFGMKFNVNVSRVEDLVQVLVTDKNDNTIYKNKLKEGVGHHIRLLK